MDLELAWENKKRRLTTTQVRMHSRPVLRPLSHFTRYKVLIGILRKGLVFKVPLYAKSIT